MKVLAVIPARRMSTRLSEKPLREISGKSLVQRVWERASLAKQVDELYVATDDQEIFDLSTSYGAKVMMTSPEIPTGSARVAAVSHLLGDKWDVVLNIQGDMPFINPKVIDGLIDFFKSNYANYSMATIAIPIYDKEEFLKTSTVKVAMTDQGRALYFSRAPIPHSRDGDVWDISMTKERVFGLKHIGLYAFKPEALSVLEDPRPSKLENVEKLEQLKLLEHGLAIGVCPVDPELMAHSIEVDTPQDLEAARAYSAQNNL